MMYILMAERVKMFAALHNANINDIVPNRKDYLLDALEHSRLDNISFGITMLYNI